MPLITATVDAANMRLRCVANGTLTFSPSADCTVIKPGIDLRDQNDDLVTTIQAGTLAMLIKQEVFMDYVRSVVEVSVRATAAGIEKGRAEVRDELKQTMGLAA